MGLKYVEDPGRRPFSLRAASSPNKSHIAGDLIPRAPRRHGCVSARLHSCRGATCACGHGSNPLRFLATSPTVQRDRGPAAKGRDKRKWAERGNTLP
jgi:hypothetical protein